MSHDPFHPDSLTVHGVDTCEDTVRVRQHLDAAGVPYTYIDLELDTRIRQQLHDAGFLATPIVVTPSGEVFSEPSESELAEIITPS